jgi:hypothetical protein
MAAIPDLAAENELLLLMTIYVYQMTLVAAIFNVVFGAEKNLTTGLADSWTMAADRRAICRDRYGPLDPVSFELRSCTLCFVYLFPEDPQFTALGPDYFYLIRGPNHTTDYDAARVYSVFTGFISAWLPELTSVRQKDYSTATGF